MPSFSAKSKPTQPTRRIVFVVFANAKLLDLTGPMQVFADAAQHGGGCYEVTVASVAGGRAMTDAAMAIPTAALSSLPEAPIDTVIVVGGAGARQAAKCAELLDQVRRLASQSRRVGSVCTGAFVLAAAGLLDGRRAVTHWDSCAAFAKKFDRISVDPDAIYVNDGNTWTSAGVTAGIDMALAMVADDAGRKAALALARSLVCYLVRPGGQSQFSSALQRQTADMQGRFDGLNGWIAENLSGDLSVETLAARANMSPRNFARVYKAKTGAPPAKAVEAMRVEAACQLLEDTDSPLAAIAEKVGFSDDERLRRAMIRARNIAPGAYRQRFGRAEHKTHATENSAT